MAHIVIALDPEDGRIDASGNLQSEHMTMPLTSRLEGSPELRDDDRRAKVGLKAYGEEPIPTLIRCLLLHTDQQ